MDLKRERRTVVNFHDSDAGKHWNSVKKLSYLYSVCVYEKVQDEEKQYKLIYILHDGKVSVPEDLPGKVHRKSLYFMPTVLTGKLRFFEFLEQISSEVKDEEDLKDRVFKYQGN